MCCRIYNLYRVCSGLKINLPTVCGNTKFYLNGILMKIDNNGTEVISTSRNEERSFGVNSGAQMFKVLSSTLYSSKIRAIIRELSCNARDSHVAANKADVPFKIHLHDITQLALQDNRIQDLKDSVRYKRESNMFSASVIHPFGETSIQHLNRPASTKYNF